MKNELKRPWQGTVLGIIYALISIIFPILTGILIYVYIEAYILSQNAMIASKMLGIFPLLYFISFVGMALLILLAVGVFTGKRWVVILVLILSIVNIFSSLFSGVKKIFSHSNVGGGSFILLSLFGLAIMSLATWLAVICLKHPFYGGNGRIDVDSFKFWKKKRGNEEMTTF